MNVVDSFTKLCELHNGSDQNTYCWKTSQLSLFGGLETFSESWPRSGMMQNGIAYRRPPLVRLTDVTGCLLWPTPTAMTGGTGVAPSHKNGTHGWNLGAAANDSLSKKPIRMWPTPTTDTSDRKKPYAQGGTPLSLAVKIWPTPTASDGKGSPKNRFLGSKAYRGNLREAVRTSEQSGQLNPTWVEWLMGFPEGWTDLNA